MVIEGGIAVGAFETVGFVILNNGEFLSDFGVIRRTCAGLLGDYNKLISVAEKV